MVYRINDPHGTQLMMRYARVESFNPQKDWSLARYSSKDSLLGGIIIKSFTGFNGSVELHTCSFRPNWASKTILYYAFHYPFEILHVRKIIGLVPESNSEAYRLDMHLGFREEALIPDVFPWVPNGMYVLGMYKEDCRWLKMKPVKLSIVGA